MQGWVLAWEAAASLDSGNVWYVVLKDVGPPVLDVTDVLNPVVPFFKHMSSVGPWCGVLPSKNSKKSLRQADCLGFWCPLSRSLCHGAGVSFRDSSPGPPPCSPLGQEHLAAPALALGPTLGLSQVSLLNALDLLSNVLRPVDFDRLRKVLDLLLPNHRNPLMTHSDPFVTPSRWRMLCGLGDNFNVSSSFSVTPSLNESLFFVSKLATSGSDVAGTPCAFQVRAHGPSASGTQARSCASRVTGSDCVDLGFQTDVLALFKMALMLAWRCEGWGSSLKCTRRLSPRGHSIAHAAFDDATLASQFHTHLFSHMFLSLCSQSCFSQCVGFWCGGSDHELVLVETRSS